MSAVVTGLDYIQVEAVSRATRIELTPELFSDIQVMEGAGVRWFAEKRKPVR